VRSLKLRGREGRLSITVFLPSNDISENVTFRAHSARRASMKLAPRLHAACIICCPLHLMTMAVVRNRIISAIRGAFVADAASMGTHWIYDPMEMAASVPSLQRPEFKDPPTPRFYSAEEFPGHYGSGMLSPYGELMLFVTEYCASCGGVDGADMSEEMKDWAMTFGGRPDSALKKFLENMEAGNKWPNCGADDSQGKYRY